MRKERHNSRKK